MQPQTSLTINMRVCVGYYCKYRSKNGSHRTVLRTLCLTMKVKWEHLWKETSARGWNAKPQSLHFGLLWVICSLTLKPINLTLPFPFCIFTIGLTVKITTGFYCVVRLLFLFLSHRTLGPKTAVKGFSVSCLRGFHSDLLNCCSVMACHCSPTIWANHSKRILTNTTTFPRQVKGNSVKNLAAGLAWPWGRLRHPPWAAEHQEAVHLQVSCLPRCLQWRRGGSFPRDLVRPVRSCWCHGSSNSILIHFSK